MTILPRRVRTEAPQAKPEVQRHNKGGGFDPAKYRNFVVTYENGRKAPNFEYLNKLTTGIKVLY